MCTEGSLVTAVTLLKELELDSAILGDTTSSTAWVRCMHLDTIDPAPSTGRFEPAIASWLLDRHGGEGVDVTICEDVGDRLVLSNQERARLSTIIHVHLQLQTVWADASTAARKRVASSPVFEDAVMLLEAVDPDGATLVRQQVGVLSKTPSGLAPVPLVSGADLIDAGMQPGPGFGQLLDQLYDAQLEDRITTCSQGVDLARTLAK